MSRQNRNSVVHGIFAQNVDVEHQHIVHFVALPFVKVIQELILTHTCTDCPKITRYPLYHRFFSQFKTDLSLVKNETPKFSKFLQIKLQKRKIREFLFKT